MEGIFQGSEPLPKKPSDISTTGTICSNAIFAAWKAISKQWAGECAAITTSGLSPFRPYRTCIKSDCSVFVGSPVQGPPLCTSTITKGSSVIIAKPIASDFSEMPGPEVVVTANLPANAAPIDVHMPAISSSVCIVFTFRFLYNASSSKIEVAGVMG